MFAGHFSENVRQHKKTPQQYRAVKDAIFASPGLICFQRGRVNMFPVHI